MTIRPATPADIPAMRQLAASAATAAHWTAAQYEALFKPEPRREVLVIEEEQGLQGFLVAAALGPEWEIENLAIAESARRRGLGTGVLSHFLAEAEREGAASVFLEVRESNAVARTAYEKCGFFEAGRRRRYYSDPEEDAVVYRRPFPAAELH